jgi:LmbE family N-acetylglucosaminyl deacetylase
MLRRILNKLESIYQYRYLSRNADGAYKFLLKKIHKSTDIDFLEKVWQLDYFREVLEPRATDLSNYRNVLVLAPHQDDEAIGCGGSLLQLASKGCNITLGFLTDGEELGNPVKSIAVRASEASKVAEMLNAHIWNLRISNTGLEIKKNHLDDLVELLNRNWDAIFSVWPLDQPPKHRLCAYLLGKALRKSEYNGDLFMYAVHTDLLPNKFVDITDKIQEKQKLIRCYESQLKAQCYDHLSKGMDAWRARFLPVSPTPRYIETFMQIPVEAYQDFMNIYRRTDTGSLFKEDAECIKSFRNIPD